MCRKVNCRKCSKVTYSGCGQHLDQVFAGVPKSQRCTCATDAPASKDSGTSGWRRLGSWVSPGRN